MKPIILTIQIFIFILCLATTFSINAAPRIAILDFELNDITSLPNTPEEIKRTASIKFQLEQALEKLGKFEIIHIENQAQHSANAGFGYLFHFNEVTASLGKQSGAEWVIVGQHSKPSFLFSYLMVHLINVKNQSLSAKYDIELKGNHAKIMERGVKALAIQTAEAIAKHQH